MAELVLPDLLDQYDQAVIDTKNQTEKVFSKAHMSTLLKELRKSKIQRPDIVLTWGEKLLKHENHIEVWNLSEQIAYAAIEEGRFDVAESILKRLETQFPDSIRVSRIRGMSHEAQGQWEEAEKLYDEVLKKDITNLAIMKRKVCIQKAKKDSKALVDAINNILNYYPSDAGSWLELGELYVAACDYSAAVHCFEELVLLEPRNAHYHCRLAEALYSIGNERILHARKHFTISLTHQNPTFNLRALYGLTASCQVIQELVSTQKDGKSPLIDEHERKVNAELLRWAREQFDEMMTKNSSNAAISTAVSAIFS